MSCEDCGRGFCHGDEVCRDAHHDHVARSTVAPPVTDGRRLPEWFETMHTDLPICPSCGDEITDSPRDDIPDGISVIECAVCGVACEVSRQVDVTYSTRRMVDERTAR